MILDDGILKIYEPPATGGVEKPAAADLTEIWESWYGDRTVSYRRYFEANQSGTGIDRLVRIVSPADPAVIHAECIVVISGSRYRIIQAQPMRDEDSGMNVVDLTLQKIGGHYERKND